MGHFSKKLTSRVERGLVGSPLDLGSAVQKHAPNWEGEVSCLMFYPPKPYLV
jgi:hypothetical protein